MLQDKSLKLSDPRVSHLLRSTLHSISTGKHCNEARTKYYITRRDGEGWTGRWLRPMFLLYAGNCQWCADKNQTEEPRG